MSQNGTGRYIQVRTSTRKCQNVRTRTYSTAYRAVQGSTERYRAVHKMVQGSTGQSTTRYKAVHGGTCQYTVCICAGPRAGGPGGGRFWCAFEIAALTAPTVASASSHCMHKLVYFITWRPGPRLPWNVPPPLWHPRPPRGRLAMPRQATGVRGVAASFPYPRPRQGRGRPADGRCRPAGRRRRRRRRRQEGRQNVGR